MNFFWEIALVVIAVLLAGGVYLASFRSRTAAVLALFAWVPLWIFTRLLWYPATDHHSPLGYPWWFWLILGLSLVVYVLSFVPKVRLTPEVRLAGVALMVIALVTVNWFGYVTSGSHHAAKSKPTTTTAPTATSACPETWEIKYADHGNSRWFADGIASIDAAKTPAEAAKAAQDWVHAVEYDPINLSGAISYFLDENVAPAALVSGKCASTEAKQLATKLELTIAQSKATPDEAPANGTNSGVSNGQAVSATTAGITGNRKAVKLVTKTGKTIWVMARCGNPVVQGKAPVPPGTTETPPPCTLKATPGYEVTPQCTLVKPPQSFNCQQNGGPTCPPNLVVQPPQENKTGGTPGASTRPTPNPTAPAPVVGHSPPASNGSGTDTGSGTGSGTSGGTTCDGSGCAGGGSAPGSGGTDSTTTSGNKNGVDSSGNSTGTGGPGSFTPPS